MTPIQRAYHLGHADWFKKGTREMRKKGNAWKRVEQADRARLDWWSKHHGVIMPWLKNCGWYADVRPVSNANWKPDLRSAIDYAMRAEKKPGERS